MGALAAGHGRHGAQRVDVPGVGGPGRRHHRHRYQPPPAVPPHGLRQPVDTHLHRTVHLDTDQRRLTQTEQVQRAADGEMRLPRGIDPQPPRQARRQPGPTRPRAGSAISRHLEGDGVGHAATAGEHPEGPPAEADPIVDPANQPHLQVSGRRSGLPGVDRLIEEGDRDLGERGHRQRRRVEQTEDPRMGHLHRVTEYLAPALAHHTARVATGLGQGLIEQAVELGQRGAAVRAARAAVDVIEGGPQDLHAELLGLLPGGEQGVCEASHTISPSPAWSRC